MKIELSKEQYHKLVKLIYAGEWLINSHREKDEVIKEFEDIEQYIYSFSGYKEFAAGDLITFDSDFQEYFPTRKFEELMHELIDDYDEDNFWEELIRRMATKEAFIKNKNATAEDVWALEDKYDAEFCENGLDRVYVDWDNKNKRK